MARKRDYAAEYARRQALAEEAGFGSYYQRRVAGTTPGAERSRARGHRGRADLLSAIRPGDIVSVVSSERNADGSYRMVTISLLSARTGEERDFVLRGKALKDDKIRELADAIDEAGAIQSPAYPLSRLYRDIGDEEEDVDLEDYDVEDEEVA